MRVLLISSSSGSRGGGEFYFQALATGLTELGHEVELIVSEHEVMDEFAETMQLVCSVRRLPYVNTYHRKLRTVGAVLDKKSQRLLSSEFRSLCPDIIHLNKQNLEDGLDILLAGRRSKLPTVATIHVTRSMANLKAKGGSVRDWVSRKSLNFAEVPLIATSSQCTKDLVGFLGDSFSGTVFNVPNGAFPVEGKINDYRLTWKCTQETIVIGTVARIEEQKNPLFVAELLRQLPSHVNFVWVGDGSLRESLVSRLLELGVQDRVIFDGWQQDARQRMAGFDLFVLPSIYEGFPFALLEAMSAGLPCVVSDVDGTKDAIQSGENGFLCPVNDLTKWKENICKLIGDEGLRNQIGLSAKKTYDKEFSLSAMARRTCEVYKQVIEDFQVLNGVTE